VGITKRPYTPDRNLFHASGNGKKWGKSACRKDSYQSAKVERTGRCQGSLETVDLDGLGVKLQPLLLINEKFLYILALIALKLDHLAHLSVDNDGAIAGELLLDDFENLLLIKLLGESLDSSQGLTSIALLDPNMDVILRVLAIQIIVIRLSEGIEAFQVFD